MFLKKLILGAITAGKRQVSKLIRLHYFVKLGEKLRIQLFEKSAAQLGGMSIGSEGLLTDSPTSFPDSSIYTQVLPA